MANTGPQPIVQPPNATPSNGIPQVDPDEILEAVEKRQRERQEKPPKDPNLWDLVPKNWRPVIAILLILVGGSSASVVANARAIWGLPERVAQVEARVIEMEKDTTEIKQAVERLEKGLLGPTSKETR